jgi:hypothetical protein
MESTIDFFRFLEREDFIALFQGATPLPMLSPRAASVNRFSGKVAQASRPRLHAQDTRATPADTPPPPCRASTYQKLRLIDRLIPEGRAWIRLRSAVGESE